MEKGENGRNKQAVEEMTVDTDTIECTYLYEILLYLFIQ